MTVVQRSQARGTLPSSLPHEVGFPLTGWSMEINMYFIENRNFLMYINLFALAIIYLQLMMDTNNWGKNIHEV